MLKNVNLRENGKLNWNASDKSVHKQFVFPSRENLFTEKKKKKNGHELFCRELIELRILFIDFFFSDLILFHSLQSRSFLIIY